MSKKNLPGQYKQAITEFIRNVNRQRSRANELHEEYKALLKDCLVTEEMLDALEKKQEKDDFGEWSISDVLSDLGISSYTEEYLHEAIIDGEIEAPVPLSVVSQVMSQVKSKERP